MTITIPVPDSFAFAVVIAVVFAFSLYKVLSWILRLFLEIFPG